jgi:GTA TIM-barrel-like domain/Putative phage tail protein
MATVVLQYAGAALGTFLGGPVGGLIGRGLGAIAGNIVDQKLFGPGTARREGPRLADLRVMASEEGAPIPRLWGRMRISGQVIWATHFEEVATTRTDKASSKGGPKSKTTEYAYFANFAVGLCEGEIARVGRVWADGKEIDLAQFTTRVYPGAETQAADSLIVAKEGAAHAPAYRGLAYIVFERMPLADFGNRLPQLSFEVVGQGGGAEAHVRTVNIIPGSTEFGYDTGVVTRRLAKGKTQSENAHASGARSDWDVSIDQLTGGCRNLKAASLVVAWFGSDLRCGVCQIRPGVENRSKVTEPEAWAAGGATRATAHVVSTVDGKPAFGGTPSDASVVRAIQDLRARGLKAVFYPFILMDVPQANALPDPYGGASQGAYPWRGRITCYPASVDKTAAVTAQVAGFVGTAQASHFGLSGTNVVYSGPAEWSYRRMVLHYARLCAAAGGVDGFVIGSELRGLTTLRSSASAFPFVSALVTLAADVKAILPSAKITYAADWSEYFGHQPGDGSNDVYFHLDPLWASAAIDAVGIDNYLPLTDWRDGHQHTDYMSGSPSAYDEAYLKAGIAGGERFDWYYASQAARDAQTRSAISDGAYGKPWVFRPKDIKGWWLNAHVNRPGGVESGGPTAWVPQSKPIWFTEAGCPAIDKGANQPNVFFEAKSSESALPYYSSGARDDVMQARYVTVMDDYWSASGAHNPVSSVYGAKMVDPERIFFWAWDARPFPHFPAREDIWSDGVNYARGHWLNGRAAAVPVAHVIAGVCGAYGFTDYRIDGGYDAIDGFVIDRPMTAREALENLLSAFAMDAVESDGLLVFRSRKQSAAQALADDALVEQAADQPLFALTRTQETELPAELKLVYTDAATDYRSAVAHARKQRGLSDREAVLHLPCVTSQEVAAQRAEILLQENWAGRDRLSVTLPPSALPWEPGDVMSFQQRLWRIESIHDGAARKVTALSYEPAIYDAAASPVRMAPADVAVVYGTPDVMVMDLAMAVSDQPASPWIAAQAKPWPGQLNVLRKVGDAAFELDRTIDAEATIGTLITPLDAGPLFVFDRVSSFDVAMRNGALASASDLEILNGGNIAAVGDAATGYEIIQFANAELIAEDTYRVSALLRGQAGSGPEMLAMRAAGADFVLLNRAVVQPRTASLANTWRFGPSQRDSGDASHLEIIAEGRALGLRPLSPAQLRMTPDGADIVFSWIRRTRLGGDPWELAEVPLGEEGQAYTIEIFDGAAVKRAAQVVAPSFRYLAADIATDFGSMPASFTVGVAQMSATFGAGAKTMRTLHA